MEKKVLLPVDASTHSKHSIQYAGRIASAVKKLTYTLLNIQPSVSQFLLEAAQTNLKAKNQLKSVIRTNREDSMKLLEKYKQEMVSMGVAKRRIDLTTRPRSLGLAKDVLDYAQEGLYDAVVVGRRGLSKAAQAFMGSLSANLVEHSRVIPVWLVDGKVRSKKIMLAVDGSESALRAVDHVAFMVGDNPEVFLTLFHVIGRGEDFSKIRFEKADRKSRQRNIARESKEFVDEFHAKGIERLKKGGIRKDRFEIRISKRVRNVGKAIVDTAKKGKYGTLVIGRSGINKSFFIGSVSRYVINKASDCVLWIVT
jgi:nucleotide-binding universal stress UspA family protein